MQIAVFLAAVVAGAAGAIAWLARPVKPDPRRKVELGGAVGALDRELAANLELMSMFDQTHTPVVLENGEYARHRSTVARHAADAATAVEALYSRIPETEAAMERRGPAQSLRAEDRLVIEGWEGDARDAQRILREALEERPRWGLRALNARLRGRSVPR